MKPTLSILSAVLPILGESEQESQPAPVGTGFLLQLAHMSLLVSAAHVADEVENSVRLYIPPGAEGGNLIELPPLPVCTKAPAGDRDKDKLDLAFWELPTSICEQLSASSMFLPSIMLLPGVKVRQPQSISFVGFPHKATQLKFGTKKFRSGPEQYTGACADEKRYSKVGAHVGQNLAIDFDPKKAISNGKQVIPKDRKGMSGGPVFAMTDGGNLAGWPPIRVVGVAIECHRQEKLMLATRIDALLQLFHSYFGINRILVSDAHITSSAQ